MFRIWYLVSRCSWLVAGDPWLGEKVDLVSTRAIRPALMAEIEPELIDA